MFIFLSIFIAVCAMAVFIAGLLALLRNHEKPENRWFFILTATLATWLVFNFIGSTVVRPGVTDLFVKLDFSMALFIGWSLLKFVVVFTSSIDDTKKESYISKLTASPYYLIFSAVVNLLLIELIITGKLLQVSIQNNTLTVTSSQLFLVYEVVIGFYFLFALGYLIAKFIKSTKQFRQKVSLMVLGLAIAALSNILTNLVFPDIFASRSVIEALNIVGYLGIFILVLCLYIAITTRRLFAIRFIVARSLAYVFLVGSIAVAYTLLITLTSYIFIDGGKTSVINIITSLVATIFVAVTFQYLRNFFNRVTNRLFFRDNYDTQDVLDQLSTITTNTLDLEKLLGQSSNLFKQTIKAGNCTFVIFDKGSTSYRLIAATQVKDDYEDLPKELRPYLKPHTPLVVEELNVASKIKDTLNKLSVELIEPMYANDTLIGFFVLTTKHNGMSYIQQDLKMLSIASDSISVATQNALRFEEIENFNLTLQDKVEKATYQLRKANERLKALDETKDDFISMASHQLRTPLTSVKGYVSMVIEGDAGKVSKSQKKLLEQAFVSSQRMVNLIADLLNVSRLKTGKFVIDAVPTNLAKMIQEEIEQLKETAKAHSLELTYNAPEHFPALMLDETKTRQVIMNFIDNAIYYTPSGGHITVALADKQSSVELTVSDDGIGVPKAEQHHLFSKFYRAGNARKARPDGTGLGLFMAKKVIVAEGGALIFTSQEGKGSTFGFTFSKAKLLAPANKSKT